MPGAETRLAAGGRRSTSPTSGRDVLRLLTCGGVDDGKTTLIGRLFDNSMLFEDQLRALESDGSGSGSTDGELGYALLLDSLQTGREQGIAIDLAYRLFATGRRRLIVADPPDHEQYTQNIATRAPTAELAVILVDARKGVLSPTRRHGYIASLLGIRHVVLAVNKMDLVGYDEGVFEAVVESYLPVATELGFEGIMCIPVSALLGDNLSVKSGAMPWYTGPTLMEHLETVDVSVDRAAGPFRMPVQWANRPDLDFRGYGGTIVGGRVRAGDPVVVAPSGKTTRVSRIVTFDGDLAEASAGQAVTLTLDDDIDIGRGDVIGAVVAQPEVTDQFQAHVIWMHGEHMLPGRAFELKIGCQTARATVTDLRYAVNVNTLERTACKALEFNEVGVCNFSLDRAVAYDPFRHNRDTGSFILIDRYSRTTVGVGMVDFGLRRATNLVWQELQIDQEARARIKGQKPCVLWFTGLSGSGKSTIADLVDKRLHALGRHTHLLDGDNVRHGLNRDLGFTEADRVENVRRISEVSKLFVEAGLIVLVSCISPFRSDRRVARELLDDGEFVEIFVDTPLDVCEDRDPKGLYKKARNGKIPNFTGIDSPYEIPANPEFRLATVEVSADEAAERLIRFLRGRGIV